MQIVTMFSVMLVVVMLCEILLRIIIQYHYTWSLHYKAFKLVFATGIHFHPSLIKPTSLPTLTGLYPYCRFLALPENIRLGSE